ncbi:MAG: hypothetical protein B0D92_04960 [Spirochaeta sp. LUC14_002_19_P3]|nr:MAG: hypothetical protein B0D92_04960 [Spirochaeta sp. LUC14_002_19_P3]
MAFPETRLRRLRTNAGIRRLTDAPNPDARKFIWPVFCVPGDTAKENIPAMPGQYRLGLNALLKEAEAAVLQGIGGILVFGIPEPACKSSDGSAACLDKGIIPSAVRALKKNFPELPVFTDVCLCAYTSHGHCGPLDARGSVDNDAALPILAETALCHARAGADGTAPSAMMDGQVQAIRKKLDGEGFSHTVIMSYSTKFASSLYGPFREANSSAPGKGDRKGYQQSFRFRNQAVLESLEDETECADILMVKPSLWYLDILHELKKRTLLPIAAYNVSGEYSMLHAAAERGWGNLHDMARESLFALERAGADIILSYWARYYGELFSGRE